MKTIETGINLKIKIANALRYKVRTPRVYGLWVWMENCLKKTRRICSEYLAKYVVKDIAPSILLTRVYDGM